MKTLIAVLIAVVLFVAGCQMTDSALLRPETDPQGNVLMTNTKTGEKKTKAEVAKLPTSEQADWAINYVGPKQPSDFPDIALASGVGTGSILALVAAGWWAIRRKKVGVAEPKTT